LKLKYNKSFEIIKIELTGKKIVYIFFVNSQKYPLIIDLTFLLLNIKQLRSAAIKNYEVWIKGWFSLVKTKHIPKNLLLN